MIASNTTAYLATVAILITLCGCSTLGMHTEPELDPDRGEMVMALRDPVIYARNEPGLSLSASDFVYLGPVETNVSGDQALYLWVGFASTIDRRRAGIEPVSFATLSLTTDQSALELQLEPWHEDAEDGPFSVNVPLVTSMRAAINGEDFEALAQAEDVALTLHSADGQALPFAHWRGRWSDWQNASEEGEVGFDVRVRSLSRR